MDNELILFDRIEVIKSTNQKYDLENNAYISFSGGKDSTILHYLIDMALPNNRIPRVFINTGIEYNYIVEFVKELASKDDRFIILKPSQPIKPMLEKYGYPFISKEQANYLHDIRYSTEYMKRRRLNGDEKGRFKLSDKYKYLINSPYPISHKCCEIMKKAPIKKYEKKTGKHPFIGTLAEESSLRTQSYLKTGCNSFNTTRPNSTPLGFWTEQDILEYIYKYKLPINKAYGEIIIDENGKYKTTKCDRTGCIACGFGVHLEKNPNRFERMKEEYPKQYDYYFNKLNYKEICDYIGIKY